MVKKRRKNASGITSPDLKKRTSLCLTVSKYRALHRKEIFITLVEKSTEMCLSFSVKTNHAPLAVRPQTDEAC